MTTDTDLGALIARVEGATTPSREIDEAIDRRLRKWPDNGDYDEGERAIWRGEPGEGMLLVRSDGFARGSMSAPRYTESIDAAMSLTDPRDFVCTGRDTEGPFARITRAMPDGSYLGGAMDAVFAATPALALVAAALRARVGVGETGGAA